MVHIGNDWDEILKPLFESENYKRIHDILKEEYFTRVIYPDMHDIFNAFKYTAFEDVKAVILGQDPYHGPNQAHGLCFSVQKGVPPPPSLVNIFKELKRDTGISPPNHGCLVQWAENGVLLLNTVLTVRQGAPNSHKNIGWIAFTDSVIELLNKRDKPIVFMLWGANARSKASLITNPGHLILQAAHPSPLSVSGFEGCGHFSKANEFLKKTGRFIDWSIQ